MKFKKKPLFFISALIVFGLLSSCVKEYVDAFDGGFSADARFQPSYGAQIAYANLSLDDFFTPNDSVLQFLEINDDGYFELYYQQEIYSLTADEQVDIPDQFFGDTVTLDQTELVSFDFDLYIEIARDFEYAFAAPEGMHIDYLTFSGGEMVVNLDSDWEIGIDINLNIPGFTDSQGSALSLDFGDISANAVDTTFNLAGYTIDLTDNESAFNKLVMQYALILDKRGNSTAADDEVRVGVQLNNISFTSVEGYFGTQTQAIDEMTIPINFATNVIDGELYLEDPQFRVFYTSSFGLPVEFDFTSLYAINSDNQQIDIDLTNSGFDPLILSIPTVLGDSVSDTLAITGQNSNLFDVLLNFPKSLTLGGNVNLNVGVDPDAYATNFLPGDGKFDITAEFRLPLSARFDFFMQDTIEFAMSSIPSIDQLESLEIILGLDNTFPIDIGIQIYFADSLNNVLDSLFSDLPAGDELEFIRGSVDGIPVHSDLNLLFETAKVDIIAPAKKLIFKAGISSAGFDNIPEEFIQITDQYNVGFNLAFKMSLDVDPTEFGGTDGGE